MATNPLSQTGEQAPEINKGHGTGALGPSDSSDSGSDVQGGAGGARDDELGLDPGTNEDETSGGSNAGLDLGDAELDGDSDSRGTGERSSAGREPRVRENNDVLPDHVETVGGVDDERETDGDDAAVDSVDDLTGDEEGIEEIDQGAYESDIGEEPRSGAKKRSRS